MSAILVIGHLKILDHKLMLISFFVLLNLTFNLYHSLIIIILFILKMWTNIIEIQYKQFDWTTVMLPIFCTAPPP